MKPIRAFFFLSLIPILSFSQTAVSNNPYPIEPAPGQWVFRDYELKPNKNPGFGTAEQRVMQRSWENIQNLSLDIHALKLPFRWNYESRIYYTFPENESANPQFDFDNQLKLSMDESENHSASAGKNNKTEADAGIVTPAPAYRGACITPRNLGTASNIYSTLLVETNQIAVNNDLNTMVFIHRNDASVLGGHSGQLRYDISTNGGATWTVNQGPLNPLSVNGTNAARFPNISLYNPTGNTTPSNAYLVYTGATVGTTWNGIVTGVRKLDGSGNTENYNQAATSQTLIPRSQVESVPGTYWSIDLVWNGTTASGFRVMKGDFNTTTNNVVWGTDTIISPNFFGGTANIADFNIAFDPTGQYGWIGALTHLTGGPVAGSYYPVFWKTEDGGNSWTGPIQVDLNDFPCITGNIATGNVASCAFDMDLTVDLYGNPHMAVTVGNGNSAYAIFYTSWHAMMDITMENGVWNAIELEEINFGRGYFGNSTDSVDMDMHPQAARTADGSKVFFTWTDSDSSVTIGNANDNPDLYGVGYNVVNKTWTMVKDFTSCDATFNNRALFPKLAPVVLGTSTQYELPVVITRLNANSSPLSPAGFHYFDNADFADSDFSTPQCSASLTVNTSGPTTFCQGGSVTLNAGSHDEILWSTGATGSQITVNSSGDYFVTVRDGCCLATDTVSITVNPLPTAGFGFSSSTFTVSFTDTTAGSPSAWVWDFGDGNTSTMQNPTHAYASAGTYTVCLIATNACGSDTICHPVGINCAPAVPTFTYTPNQLQLSFFGNSSATVSSWLWDFGDGNTSTFQNPLHTYLSPGTFTVCLTTTDSCGSDSSCQVINVTCPQPVSGFSYSSTGLIVSFTDGSTGTPTGWSWDFGDGGTSTNQSPSHTYATNGIYTVCLSTTNDCGGDTLCQQVDLLVGVEDGLDDGGILVYPNPANEVLMIRNGGEMAFEGDISLVDVTGRVVWELASAELAVGEMIRVDVGDLVAGVYLLRFGNGDGGFVRRVLVE